MNPINAMRPTIPAELVEAGFSFVPGERMRAWLEDSGSLADWPAFAASWEDLAADTYLADHGRYRRRRYAVFGMNAGGELIRAPHQPHYQAREYNPLQGGIQRWFEPIAPSVAQSHSLHTILKFGASVFGALQAGVAGHIEVHQFRIEAHPNAPGLPTPEGVHRDGVDWVLVLLIRRSNIASGTTTIHAADGTELGSFTLSQPFDAALVNDHRVFHGVTPVTPLDPQQPAWRDVLVATYRVDPASNGAASR